MYLGISVLVATLHLSQFSNLAAIHDNTVQLQLYLFVQSQQLFSALSRG